MESLINSISKSTSTLGFALLLILLAEIPVSKTTKVSAETSEIGEICELQTSRNPSVLETESKCLYETGRYNEAAQKWEQAAKEYEKIGDKINQGLALSNLSLSYQKLGSWEQAKTYIQASLQVLRPKNNQNTSYNRLQAYAQALDIQANLAYAQNQTEEALKIWKQAEQIYIQIEDNSRLMVNQLNQAQALQILGYHVQAEKNLSKWKEILTTGKWQQLSKPRQINQIDSKTQAQGLRILANTYRLLGNLDESEKVLEKAIELNLPKEEKAAMFLSLGNTQRAKAKNLRELREANDYKEYKDCKQYESNDKKQLKQLSVDESQKELSESYYTKKAKESYQQAVDILNQAISSSPNNNIKNPSNYLLKNKIQIQLNQISLLSELKENNAQSDDKQILGEIKAKLKQLPEGRIKIFAQINLAKSLMCLEESKNQTKNYSYLESANLLKDAYKDAQKLGEEHRDGKKIGDERAMSYALGSLGRLYEKKKRFSEAEKVTKQALSLAQSISAPDITYQLQWQLGRIIVKDSEEKRRTEAIKVYEEAAETLRTIRGDLLAINRDVQFSFRDNIEPVYRELISLLLPADEQPSQENLQKSLYYAETIQLAELENFFGCSLQNIGIEKINLNNSRESTKRRIIKRVNDFAKNEPESALVFPIILQNNLAVIVKFPGKKDLLYYPNKIKDVTEVTEVLKNAKESLEGDEGGLSNDQKNNLEKIYNWIIKPYASFLKEGKNNKVKSLIFILDNSLRKIPIAGLYDGEKYLVDTDYELAIAPSIQLLRTKKESQKIDLRTIIAESVFKRKNFDPLIGNPSKIIEDVLAKYEPKVLSGGGFTKKTLKETLQSYNYSILHLITHGQFSSNLKKAFILTDDNPDSPNIKDFSINFDAFGDFLRPRNSNKAATVDLLVMSACETADGDNRAVLGMAGIAVKSGTSTTIAPLWYVNQKATKILMGFFYEELIKTKDSSKALKQAQRRFKDKYKDELDMVGPYFWSSFIVVRT